MLRVLQVAFVYNLVFKFIKLINTMLSVCYWFQIYLISDLASLVTIQTNQKTAEY